MLIGDVAEVCKEQCVGLVAVVNGPIPSVCSAEPAACRLRISATAACAAMVVIVSGLSEVLKSRAATGQRQWRGQRTGPGQRHPGRPSGCSWRRRRHEGRRRGARRQLPQAAPQPPRLYAGRRRRARRRNAHVAVVLSRSDVFSSSPLMTDPAVCEMFQPTVADILSQYHAVEFLRM